MLDEVRSQQEWSLCADWTRVTDDVLNPHVTSFRPFRGEGDATQMALMKGGIEPGHLVMAARSNQGCSVNVTVSRREMRSWTTPNLRATWANLAQGGLVAMGTLWGFVRFPLVPHQNRRRPAMKALVPILTLILAIAFSAPAPKSQSACEKAGMKWDATASAPKVKCNPAFA